MITLTKEQRKALYRVYKNHRIPTSYKEFRKTAAPYIGSQCIMVHVPSCISANGMWLGIEKDGYTHS